MRIHSISIIFSIIAGSLTGCASTTGIDPSALNLSASKSHVEIKEPFSWEERFNIDKSNQHLTLAAGIYTAKYDDGTFGTYYEGKGKCLSTKVTYDDKNRKEISSAMRCGIFVPNASENRALVYFYIDPVANRKMIEDSGASGTLIHGLAKAEENNLKHLMYQPKDSELKAAIKVVK